MKSLKEIVLEAEAENKVVFMTIDGLLSVNIDKFVLQPTEGLLYDLNRNRATILTFIDNPQFVNNFAVMKVITKLKEMLEVQNGKRIFK